MIVHYQACPVCGSNRIAPLFKATDHTVSGEQFTICQCSDCTLRFTQDVPDEASIGPYYKAEEYISHTDSSKGLINKLYKEVRKITLKQKVALLKKTTGLEKGKVLDMGCGTGAFLAAMRTAGWEVMGAEPDAAARNTAKALHGVEALVPQDALTLAPSSFDAISMWHVLEHVHNLHGYIEALKALLKPNGRFVIAVPNYTSTDAEAYRLDWAGYDVPRHLYHFTPQSMKHLLEQHGLVIAAKKPMWFDAFYVSMLSSRYKNGRMNLLGAVFTGLRSNLHTVTNTDRCSSIIYIVKKA